MSTLVLCQCKLPVPCYTRRFLCSCILLILIVLSAVHGADCLYARISLYSLKLPAGISRRGAALASIRSTRRRSNGPGLLALLHHHALPLSVAIYFLFLLTTLVSTPWLKCGSTSYSFSGAAILPPCVWSPWELKFSLAHITQTTQFSVTFSYVPHRCSIAYHAMRRAQTWTYNLLKTIRVKKTLNVDAC